MKIEKRKLNAFISYQTSDKIAAGKLKQDLSNFAIDSFLAHDDLEVSDEWQNEILENIKKSSLFICLLSKNYLNSHFCMQESGMAILLNTTIIPLSLDSTISPGFISKFQSKKVDPLNPTIRDIIPGLLKHDKNEGIRVIIDLIGHSRTYRNAEANFEFIEPFLDELTENQASALIEKIIDNNQIHHASLCVIKYIPRIVEAYFSLLTKTEYHKLKRFCSAFGVSI